VSLPDEFEHLHSSTAAMPVPSRLGDPLRPARRARTKSFRPAIVVREGILAPAAGGFETRPYGIIGTSTRIGRNLCAKGSPHQVF
jgi:hypothetical protein